MSDQLYNIEVCSPSDLPQTEISRCIQMVVQGGAVDKNYVTKYLPQAKLLAVVRTRSKDNNIVGVGAVKVTRLEKARAIAKDSKFTFDESIPELGYVAVDSSHRNNKLSYRIVKQLCLKHTGQLFATTDNVYMQGPLKCSKFQREGQEWQGRKGMLSLWIKPR